MGRSRRKLKKFNPKVTRKPKRKVSTKSSVPIDILDGHDTLVTKLGKSAEWDDQIRFSKNYSVNGLVADPNAHFGRNRPLATETQVEDQEEDESHEDSDTDDDLRQFEGKQRHDGKRAELRKLTTTQQAIIKALIEAHGTNIEAMERDRKRNKMLLPGSKLRKMIESYNACGDKGRCGFRAPIKHSR